MKFVNNLDISISKNQNDIAVILGSILPLELLEEIFSKRENLLEINKRDINIERKNIMEIRHNDIEVLLLDLIDIKSFPLNRAAYLRISFGNKYQLDIKMKYNYNMKYYITLILVKAINYFKYRYNNDRKYIKSHIIQNFAKKLSHDFSEESLYIFKSIISIIESENNDSDIKYISKHFEIENIELFIITEPEYFKIDYIKDKKSNSLFMANNRLVFQSIIIMIETALSIKSK